MRLRSELRKTELLLIRIGEEVKEMSGEEEEISPSAQIGTLEGIEEIRIFTDKIGLAIKIIGGEITIEEVFKEGGVREEEPEPLIRIESQ